MPHHMIHTTHHNTHDLPLHSPPGTPKLDFANSNSLIVLIEAKHGQNIINSHTNQTAFYIHKWFTSKYDDVSNVMHYFYLKQTVLASLAGMLTTLPAL